MSDSILERYAGRERRGVAGFDNQGDVEVSEDLGSFGWLRGVRDRAMMLELRKKDGSIMAVGYGWLDGAEFDPSEGITLYIMGRTVRIKGRNLNAESRPLVRLYQGIVRHKVPWMCEADQAAGLMAPDGSPVIERIEW